MKHLLLALGFAAFTLPAAYAQLQDHSHSNEYSVFSGYSHMAENKKGAAISKERIVRNFPGWVGRYDRISGGAINIYGKGMQLAGATPAEKAANGMSQKLSDLGVNATEWVVTRDAATSFASFIDYKQVLRGHEVFLSRIGFRFANNGLLTSIKLNNYGSKTSASAPSISAAAATDATALTQGLTEVSITSRKLMEDWVWFPVPSGARYILHPAYEVRMEGKDLHSGKPVSFTCFIDGTDGKLLYRSDAVQDVVDVTVLGEVKKATILSPVTQEPLSSLQMLIGSNSYITDDNGDAVTNVTGPSTANITLQGPWSVVTDAPTGNNVPSASIPLTEGSNTIVLPQGNMNSRHINAFYHSNKVHDFQKRFFAFDPLTETVMDRLFSVRVDVSGGSCNAFYSGGTLNFYPAGNGCPSFAEISDIIYHEYGHGINDYIYRTIKGSTGRGMINGGLNEGHADVWAFSINNDAIVGENSMGSGTNIRRYDQNIKVYPRDIVDEVHADGEIIAGAWYDLAINLNDFEKMTEIFAKSYSSASDGANGTEGDVYFDVLLAAVEADDTDGDFTNGTPNLVAILRAFARHGIYLMNDAKLTHTELAHQPLNKAVAVNATLDIPFPTLFGGLKLFYRDRKSASWDTVSMVRGSGNSFSGQIPATASPAVIEYYFALYDTSGMPTVRWPYAFDQDPALAQDVTIPYQYGVGITQRLYTGFEQNDPNWILGEAGDNATSGQWIIAKPVGTTVSSASGSIQVQPGTDYSGNGRCLVTGNGSSLPTSADVDGGITTATSPNFDLSGMTYPVVEFYRWYTNNTGDNPNNDYWQAQLRSTASSLWRNVDYTMASDASWRRKLIAVKDLYPGQVTIQVRFIAADRTTTGTGSGQSTVEAAVDDFAIYDLGAVGVGTSPDMLKAQIFPNPADQMVNITLPQGASGKAGIYDLTGKAITEVTVSADSSNYQISTKSIAAGTYLVVVQTNALVQTQKVVVAH
ncbi:MAG: T9SS type A sorting domain-containing protein [Sphingobacteriales bacterium]|nr:MAG: T9SS type A sorting domain-containing protein [Sphingobacteriales bacterium]